MGRSVGRSSNIGLGGERLMFLEGRASGYGSLGGSPGRVLAGVTPDRTKDIGVLVVVGSGSLRDGRVELECSSPVDGGSESVVDQFVGIGIVNYLESATDSGHTIELSDGSVCHSRIKELGFVDLHVSFYSLLGEKAYEAKSVSRYNSFDISNLLKTVLVCQLSDQRRMCTTDPDGILGDRFTIDHLEDDPTFGVLGEILGTSDFRDRLMIRTIVE